MPDQYYRVPAMRMVLDLAVYLGMLAVFSTAVLFHEDGPLTPGEVAFSFYLLASGQHTMLNSVPSSYMYEFVASVAASLESCSHASRPPPDDVEG